MIERIVDGGQLLALVIRAGYSGPAGIAFFTGPTDTQQVGYMRWPKGHAVEPHVHRDVPREIRYTREVLVMRSGCVRLDLYTESKKFVCSTLLKPQDVVLLAGGGHGLEMLEESELIEVKQGPYAGDLDKEKFAAAPAASGDATEDQP